MVNETGRSFLNTSNTGVCISLYMMLALMISPVKADIQIPDDRHLGFSGIEYHVPRNTRMVLYKYKAQKNKTLSEASELEADTRGVLEMSDSFRDVQGVDQDVVADCSIAIGNNSKTDIFARKEQVVIIEGDVVNLGDCGR